MNVFRYLQQMKTKKTKAAQKLKILKEKETAVIEGENLLDAEISFNDVLESQVDSSQGFARKKSSDHRDSYQGDATDVIDSHIRGEISLNVSAIDEGHRSQNPSEPYGERGDEGTVVLPENEKDDPSEVTQGRRGPGAFETTYREITAGRSQSKEAEKVSYGDVYENDSLHLNGSPSETVDGLLKKSEHLRIAQEKINDLENEVEDLRKQNHELANDAESIASLNESYSAQIENLKMELTHVKLTLGEEAKILRHSMYEKERTIAELKQTNGDLKSKVEHNFKSIRKRERDLEYRLELAKVDEAALLKSKDKMILDLRRELEKKDQEKTAFERKNKEHFQKIQEQQQTVRTVVRALRIALTRLEGDFGVDFEVLKKAE